MFTLKKFLWKTDYGKLPEIIRSDPIRLRKEFLSLAVNREEHFLLRLRSLRILNSHAELFGLFTPLERQSLITAFETEFPPNRLREVSKKVGSDGFVEGWLVFCYCIAVARITLDNKSDIVNSTREAFKGTSRASTLEVYLEKIERLKTDATDGWPMEAG